MTRKSRDSAIRNFIYNYALRRRAAKFSSCYACEIFGLHKNIAQKGDKRVQYNLNLLYSESDGVEASINLAIKWTRKSARQGFAEAINWLNDNAINPNPNFMSFFFGLAFIFAIAENDKLRIQKSPDFSGLFMSYSFFTLLLSTLSRLSPGRVQNPYRLRR